VGTNLAEKETNLIAVIDAAEGYKGPGRELGAVVDEPREGLKLTSAYTVKKEFAPLRPTMPSG
jgi:hypothetical protein